MNATLVQALLTSAFPAVLAKPSEVPHHQLFQLLGKLTDKQYTLQAKYDDLTSQMVFVNAQALPLADDERTTLATRLLEAIADKAFWKNLPQTSDGYATTTYTVGNVTFKRVRAQAEHDQFNWTIVTA